MPPRITSPTDAAPGDRASAARIADGRIADGRIADGRIACPECRLVHRRRRPAAGTKAVCVRCAAVLERALLVRPIDSALLAASALGLYAAAHLAPLLSLKQAGRESTMTLLETVTELWRQGRVETAAVVAFGLLITPVVFLLLRLGLSLVRLARGEPNAPRGRGIVGRFERLERALNEWVMLDIFLLGVVVATVKLGDLTDARFEPGAVALAAAALLTLWLALAFEPRDRPSPDRSNIALTWAFLLAAAILYIPANLYPIMTTRFLGTPCSHTIVQGVAELAEAGMWIIAAIVFIASVLVPLLKIAALGALLLTVQRPSSCSPLRRARIFRLVQRIGRWSMLDVFVVAVLVALVDFGPLASIRPAPGVAAFAAVVVLTLFAARTFDPAWLWNTTASSDPAANPS